MLSSRNSSRVTISLLGEVEQGRTPPWGWAALLFWMPSWGRGPFRGGGYSWRLRVGRPEVLASRGRVAVSLLGIRSSLLKLSDLPWSWSEEPGVRAGDIAHISPPLPPVGSMMPAAHLEEDPVREPRAHFSQAGILHVKNTLECLEFGTK